jgi:hypothetical protein
MKLVSRKHVCTHLSKEKKKGFGQNEGTKYKNQSWNYEQF